MERLIDNALIYGAMFEVGEKHLVGRYNEALDGFGLPKTKLKKFVIDASGYSPEVAKELKDEDYLNPQGINRRFIILSPEQESLPVVYHKFSSTYDLLMTFFQKNSESLRTLTLKDVVFGEIENSTFRIETVDDILSIREVEFRLRTGGQIFEKAGELQTLLDRFLAEKDSWQDNQLMNEILMRGDLVGDIRYNNIVPRHTRFQQPSFWTDHFDGLYVFHEDDGKVAVMGRGENPKFLQEAHGEFRFINLDDEERVYNYLLASGRIKGLEPAWLKLSGLAQLRSEILVRTSIGVQDKKAVLSSLDPNSVRNWLYNNFDDIIDGDAFSFLKRIEKGLMNDVLPSLKNVAAALKLMVVRANPDHGDRVLVARLLTEFAPFDFYTKFAVNKQAFYEAYDGLAENQRDYVVAKITNNYFPERRKYWETLFAKPED